MGKTTRDGRAWSPAYLLEINHERCVGCGRCFKVCGQAVLGLRGVSEDGDLVDPDDEDAEVERKVMTIVDEGACIGCQACARVCTKDAPRHERSLPKAAGPAARRVLPGAAAP